MSERRLRNIFLAGTLFFLLILIGMTIDSLGQVISTRTPPLTEAVVAGKQIWQSKNCPQLALGGGIAPQDSGGQTDLVREGEGLFAQKGCNACHMINGQGAPGPGPDLSRIGSQPYDDLPNTPEFLDQWLQNPQATKPDTTMPRIEMTETEREALVAYIWFLLAAVVAPAVVAGSSMGAEVAGSGGPILIFGWILQFGYALIPYLFVRGFQPRRPGRLGGTWFSLMTINGGGALYFTNLFLATDPGALRGVAYIFWIISLIPILMELRGIIHADSGRIEETALEELAVPE